MTIENIYYQIYNFGPLLFKAKINENDLNEIFKLCKKDINKDMRKNLAGIIEHEYSIDKEKYFKIITKYLNIYKSVYEKWYARNIVDITIDSTWVNFMQAGDYNPPHIHTKCDLSSVVYLKIPEEIKREHDSYLGTLSGAGSITFQYGETVSGSINEIRGFPKEGDFYIFPSHLRHYVAPFKSKVERVSVAANYVIK
jgi:uncharacterized protein (TIGR02466 family)